VVKLNNLTVTSRSFRNMKTHQWRECRYVVSATVLHHHVTVKITNILWSLEKAW